MTFLLCHRRRVVRSLKILLTCGLVRTERGVAGKCGADVM